MMKIVFTVLMFTAIASANMEMTSQAVDSSPQFYRNFTQKVRQAGEFQIPLPGANTNLSYSFQLALPVYPLPLIADLHLASGNKYFFRSFWDRILFKDDSFIIMNGEKLPLTCIFIVGQDNRFTDPKMNSPLLPEFILKIYLVANDYSCQGPITPGWPVTGGRKENWGNYIYYEVRDPTIMLPVEAKLRYRWNDYNIVLVDRGAQ